MIHRFIILGALLAGSLGAQTSAQTSARFQVPITVSNGANSQLLLIGVSGDGDGGTIQDNTIGVDYDPSFGAYQELVAPPTPPPPYDFDSRFLTIPGRTPTFPTGLGGGVYKDFRGFSGPAQVDTFRINVSGDAVDLAPTTISWPSNLSTYGSAWMIQPLSGSEWTPVDMLSATSVVIPAGVLQRNALIIKTGALTDVRQHDRGDVIPDRFILEQNYPNPFNPSTTIRFSVQRAGRVSLRIYNLIGQEVATLANEDLAPGTYDVPLRGEALASGVYLYRLEAPGYTAVRKLTLLR